MVNKLIGYSIVFIILCILYFLSQSDPDIKVYRELEKAIEINNIELVKTLLSEHKEIVDFEVGLLPLHKAVFYCRKDIAEIMLEFGANVNAKSGRHNSTALHTAAARCFNKDTIEMLIEKGADINAKDDFSETPLMTAAEYGNIESMKLLIEKGAKINEQSRHYGTPLDYAIEKDQRDAVCLLLKHGGKSKRGNIELKYKCK